MDREECPVAVDTEEYSASSGAPADEMDQSSTREPNPVQDGPAQIVEALLFASDTPLSAARLADLSEAGTARDVRRLVDDLNDKYATVGLSFRIEEIAKGFQMMTLPAYRPWLAKLANHHSQTRLTAAALETASIVAYKQPIIRADVEAIRGVACGEVLNRLREMGLIKIVGRAEIVGRPMLYGTTKKFLDVFGLADLDDLPPLEALEFKKRDETPNATEADTSPTAGQDAPDANEPPERAAASA